MTLSRRRTTDGSEELSNYALGEAAGLCACFDLSFAAYNFAGRPGFFSYAEMHRRARHEWIAPLRQALIDDNPGH